MGRYLSFPRQEHEYFENIENSIRGNFYINKFDEEVPSTSSVDKDFTLNDESLLDPDNIDCEFVRIKDE